MKFSQKVRSTFLQGVFISFIILAGLSFFLFSRSFNHYLIQERQKKFDRLETLTRQLFLNSNSPQDFAAFFTYMTEERIDIQVFDANHELKTQFTNTDPDLKRGPQGEYVTKEFKITRDNQVIGSVVFGYFEQNYLNPAAQSFKDSLSVSLLIASMAAFFIAFIASNYLSKGIARPIMALSESTEKMKNGVYTDVDLPTSDVYEVNQLSKDLGYLAKSLELQKNIRKSYAQDISHELRTPITNIQLHLEAMEDGIIPCDQENIHTLLMESQRLNGLISDLKKSFDKDVDALEIKNSTFNLNDLLGDLAKSFEGRFQRYGVGLKIDAPVRLEITSDLEKIRTILQNLLTNALKATKECPNPMVVLKVTKRSDKLLLAVKDNGIGISDENLTKIFDRFYRVDDARNTKENGYGLGLSIAQNMAVRLGGKILVNSKPNQGSEFILELNTDDIDATEIIEPTEK